MILEDKKTEKKTKVRPFLKWAGGKGQLIGQLRQLYPKELYNGEIEKYFEPFVGGGAILFDMIQNFKIKSAYISDNNTDLILAYQVIQKKAIDLSHILEEFQKQYDKTKSSEREETFYKIREQFNIQRELINYNKFSDVWILRAAQLIFLNKTCYNGLFRLNSRGGFNVPFGRYINPRIFDAENIKAISKLLNHVDIRMANYKDCFDQITEKSFVYFDPPYRPLSKTANFTTYSGIAFHDKEQTELANFYKKIDNEKHAKLMLSNSDPKNENQEDNFFETIYRGYNLERISAMRAINCNGSNRGKINEIVVTNYKYI